MMINNCKSFKYLKMLYWASHCPCRSHR